MASGAGQPSQPSDPVSLLIEDHVLFKTFLNDRIPALLTAAAAGNVEELKILRDDLTTRLSQHTSLEEQTIQEFYPKEIYAEILKQDAEEKTLVDNFRVAPLSDIVKFTELFNKMKSVLLTHINYEETVSFPALRRVLTAEQSSKLFDKMVSMQKSGMLPTRPHPIAGPSASLPAKIMHPGAAVVDKIADAISGRGASAEAGRAGGL